MNWIFGLHVVYGLVQVNLKSVDMSFGTPCTLSVLIKRYLKAGGVCHYRMRIQSAAARPGLVPPIDYHQMFHNFLGALLRKKTRHKYTRRLDF
jgi:hypothetical protein